MGYTLISLAFWTFFVVTLFMLFFPFAIVWAITAPFDRRRLVAHIMTSAWAGLYIAVNPMWHLRVTGREKLPWRGRAVLVANHASLIDILVVYGLYKPFKWISKVEVFKLPIIGWLMRMNNYIPLTRGERASVIKMMQHCEELLRQGEPLLFFPEGTRSEDGRLKSFKDGAFQLARSTGAPVYPVAILGTAQGLPKHGLMLKNSMRARVEVLDPLDPADFESVAALRNETRARLAAALGQAPEAQPSEPISETHSRDETPESPEAV
jgi:1-acyl-sn-glycerol-3-phosphate acyltransferase